MYEGKTVNIRLNLKFRVMKSKAINLMVRIQKYHTNCIIPMHDPQSQGHIHGWMNPKKRRKGNKYMPFLWSSYSNYTGDTSRTKRVASLGLRVMSILLNCKLQHEGTWPLAYGQVGYLSEVPYTTDMQFYCLFWITFICRKTPAKWVRNSYNKIRWSSLLGIKVLLKDCWLRGSLADPGGGATILSFIFLY